MTEPTNAFAWPADFPRIPDRPWASQPVDRRGLAYDAMGSHLWYKNLDLTVQQIAAHLQPGAILVDFSAGTGLLADRVLRSVPGVGIIMAEPSAGFLGAALEKLRANERVAFRLLAFLAEQRRLERLDEALGPAMVAHGVDAVVSTNAVHLYTDLPGTVRAWYDCIRPGGSVFVQSAEIKNPGAHPGSLLITDVVSKLLRRAREIVLEDDAYAAYRAVLADAARMKVYEDLEGKVFFPPKSVDQYVEVLAGAGFVVEETIAKRTPVGNREWFEATTVYPTLLAWFGGSEKAGDPPPSAEVIAARNALLSRANDELFGKAETYDACWTYITGRKP
jgi:hypothetical protein